MKIAFTGGGTAGHAIVNTLLIPYLKEKECHIMYIGSHNGMEKEMISAIGDIPYYEISTGKLRRYFSLENIRDVFRVVKGCFEAYKILKKQRPQVLYSGGGYVSVPAVFAAKALGIPVLIRETDKSMGLANRICLPFAQKIYTAFPDTQMPIPKKAIVSYPGVLIRPSLFEISQHTQISFANEKPICLIMGGSLGAQKINNVVWSNISELINNFNIIHICGRGNMNEEVAYNDSYCQLEYVYDEMGTFLSAADVVISRCGSNAILELLALGKRTVLIPMGSKSSRGEQAQNASFAEEYGSAVVLDENLLSAETLLLSLKQVLQIERSLHLTVNKNQLLCSIHAHIADILNISYSQIEKDFYNHFTYNQKLNFDELSDLELAIYDEIVSISADYW